MKYIFLFWGLCFTLIGCDNRNPNLNADGRDELASHEIAVPVPTREMAYRAEFYVPIYSDIYLDASSQETLLAATLSIRNTSHTDSLFISKIDYYNTEGELVRNYINSQIALNPMATINYVVDKEDDTGGPGANFIVQLSGRHSGLRPLIQAVMIGQKGNIGFAFATNGFTTTD